MGDLRTRLVDLLAEAGYDAGEKDVILSGGPGYRFKEWMKVEERPADDGEPNTPAPAVATPTPPAVPADLLNERQHWALDQLRRAKPLRQLFGDDFVEALIMVKEVEHEAYQRVISSWEREHLLLNV